MQIVKTSDDSFSAYNDKYDDYYHSIKDGASLETIYKHIVPVFSFINKDSIRILDICFGLGYNSLFALAYTKWLNLVKNTNLKVEIFSPEIDISLLESLQNFQYPKILYNYLDLNQILKCIAKNSKFKTHNLSLDVFRGDANIYTQQFKDNFFDIIFQDAFSPSKNKDLWNIEFFNNLYRILNKNGIITTYSTSPFIRKNASLSGFFIFNMQFKKLKNGSVFLKKNIKINPLDSVMFDTI